MTTFYTFTKTSDPGGPPIVAADHENRVYFYVANTKLWHHNPWLEVQLDTHDDDDWTATPVPAGEVADLIAGVRKIDGRGYSGEHLRDLKTQPLEDKRTSAEIGLHTTANARPVAGGDIRELLLALPIGQSREVARYTVDRKAVAQNLAYELNSGKRKRLADIGISAIAATAGPDIVVSIKRTKPPAGARRHVSAGQPAPRQR